MDNTHSGSIKGLEDEAHIKPPFVHHVRVCTEGTYDAICMHMFSESRTVGCQHKVFLCVPEFRSSADPRRLAKTLLDWQRIDVLDSIVLIRPDRRP